MTMPSVSTTPAQHSLKSIVITQLIAFVGFVLVPALVTMIAPVSWVKFQRQGDRISVRAQTCLFFVVPFRTVSVDPLIAVDERTLTGSITNERRVGRQDIKRRADDEGFLVMKGPEQSAEVQVSPASLKSVLEKANAFLKDPAATDLKMFVVANWKFSVGGGGFVSLLTLLYLVGVTLAIGKGILTFVRRVGPS
ncbi:MAG: hypothetical protein U1F71_05680 [Verrucomicrobiaceae bacterium]